MVKIPRAPELGNFPLKTVVIGLILLCATIAAGLFALNHLESTRARQAQEQEAKYQKTADDIARKVAGSIAPIRAKLADLAKQPLIADALSKELAVRKEIAAGVVANIEGALLLRILAPGESNISRTESPPLTFASIEMLRIALDSAKQIPVEIHLGGTDNEHIVMIERIYEGEQLKGFVHLSLSPSIIRNAVSAIDPQGGYLEVRQRAISGPPVVIARLGTPPSAQKASLVSQVPGTAFLASYRYGTGAGQLKSFYQFIVPATVLLALLLLGGLLRSRLRKPAAGGNLDVEYAGAIKAVLDGTNPGLEELLPGGSGQFPVQDTAETEEPPSDSLPSGLDIDFDLEEAQKQTAEMVDHGPAELGIEITETTTEELATLVPTKIFRSYDIRGVVGETLTADGVYQIGRALGTEARHLGEQTVIVGRDGRNSSPELREGLIEGLRDSGCDVLDVGLVPTPILYFATHYLDSHSGVMVTGSHNPPEYNGLKVVLNGQTLSGDAIQAIRTRVETQDYARGEGKMQSMEIIPDYIRRVGEEVPVTFDALKVVVDCANSVPGIVAPHILRAIGHDVIELYCDVDGDFPNHHPDPSQPQNLADLIAAVAQEDADIGLAFDGDGDRLGVVDNQGNIIWPDKQLMLFARDVLKNNPGAKVIYDVKCSTGLPQDVQAHGGEALMSRSGHSIIKAKMEATGALLAGDLSGHIFFKDRWYGFDDALYAAARLLEILVDAERPSAEVFAELPGGVATPELHIPMSEEQHQPFMEKILSAAKFDDAEITTLDGLRVDLATGWGLIRPSNTTPAIVLRFEGDNESSLEEIKSKFRELLQSVDETIQLPF
ncbi:MAG: phosphomannomutase/phosphoglucomutase [Gammaproteobacteria bacterium]